MLVWFCCALFALAICMVMFLFCSNLYIQLLVYIICMFFMANGIFYAGLLQDLDPKQLLKYVIFFKVIKYKAVFLS